MMMDRGTGWGAVVPSAAGLALAILALSLPGSAHAGGLRCSIGEVVVQNLAAGHTWSLRSLANLPLVLTNSGDDSVIVRVDPHVPGKDQLRHDAEPVGAASWGYAVPDSFALAPHETKLVDLGLRIPNDTTLCGRTFQVMFWSHTLATPGNMLAYGLDSRVIFSVARPESANITDGGGDLAIVLAPAEIRLPPAVPGRVVQLDDPLRAPLIVRNTSSEPRTVEVSAIRARDSESRLPAGYGELLDAAQVTLTPQRFTLAPGEERRITGSVKFRAGAAMPKTPLLCVVSAAAVDRPVLTRIYARIVAEPR